MRLRDLTAAVLPALVLALAAPSQRLLFWQRDNLVPAPVAAPNLAGVLRILLEGPSPAEVAAGFSTRIPAGTRLVSVDVDAGRATITLSHEFVARRPAHGNREDAVEQITKTAFLSAPLRGVGLAVQLSDGRIVTLDRALGDGPATAPVSPLPPLRPSSVSGALSGRTIVISPGHGYYWHSTLGWTTQRGNIGGLIEDIHNNEIAMRYLIPALENMGARVISCRERGEITQEMLVDNDHGPPGYTETGAWSTSASAGYAGGTYRFAGTALTTTATATWTAAVPAAGTYPVSVFYRASGNRSPDARYVVHHNGGATEITVDQTRDDRRWVHLGNFHFTPQAGATVVLENRSSNPGGVVIADAVRVGAGFGSIVRGGSTSSTPRWQEACRYWAEFSGAPSSVYTNPGCSEDSCEDVTARPKLAEWRGADAFISVHTNAGGGTGTSSFIYNGVPTPGSPELQQAVHAQLVGDIRSLYCASWVDRGLKSANFGEVRELQTMPGVLLELAFHDTPGSKDHDALHDPEFRRICGRAIARGVKDYFAPEAADPPFTPDWLAVVQDGSFGLALAWPAADRATGYAIEQAVDGKGFVEVAQTPHLTWSTDPLPPGTTLSFRIRALNASGRSFPTDVLTGGTSHTGAAEVLLVQGFDRLGARIKAPDNTKDYLRLHADAIRRAGEFSLGFDAATNDALLAGQVALASYRAVDWLLGEESTADETFSTAEQALVSAYVGAGGRLLVSGAEVGWDLDFLGTPADRAFYNNVLGARYVGDDAGTYTANPTTGIWQGGAPVVFDDGSQGTYDVDFPDIITAFDTKSQVNLLYDTGGGAAIQRIDGAARIVYLGFPLETIVDPAVRSDVVTRALRFLLTPRALECAPAVGPGSSLSIDVAVPAEPGAPFILASALGLGAVPLPSGHVLGLLPDAVFTLSLTPQNGIFLGFQGLLDGSGHANGTFAVPPLAFLSGLDFYFSGVTVAGTNVATMLPWARTEVQ